MGSIAGLVADFQNRAILLSVHDGQIRYRAPAGALNEADKAALRAHRDEILAFLSAREAGRGLRMIQARSGPLTASVAQEMWWRFAGGADEGKPVALNIPMTGHFPGAAPDAVIAAIRAVIRRHDTLRTRIRVEHDHLALSLNEADAFAVEEYDLTHLASEDAAAIAQAQARAHCAQVIPMEGAWLTRARIWRLPRGVVAAISANHIIADAGSRNIVMEELQDALAGVAPRAMVPYNDFSLAERDYLAGPSGDALIGHWRRWYEQSPEMLSPIEKTPLRWGAGDRIVCNFSMPSRLLAAVRALAGQLRTTPFAIHLTVFSIALARWSRTADFTVRVLGDKRATLDLSGTVGLMFCADAIAVHAPPDAAFETVLRDISRDYDAALALRLPSLHFYPPQAVRPGIEPADHRVKIPAVFNYYAAGTANEKAQADAAPGVDETLPWPAPVQRLAPARWTRPSAPIFLHLMDRGGWADCSLHFFAGVVSDAEQQSFIDALFRAYEEFAPA